MAVNYENFIKLVESYNPDEVIRVKKAYEVAKKLHEGQYRQSGEEYITHPLNVAYILANISEDMAAEQKARATYEALINETNDEDVLSVLLFLRQREIIHFNRFKTLFEYYKKMGY